MHAVYHDASVGSTLIMRQLPPV